MRYLIPLAIASLLVSVVSAQSGEQVGTQCQLDSTYDGISVSPQGAALQIIDMTNSSVQHTGGSPNKFDMLVFHDPGSPTCDPSVMVKYGQRYDSARGGMFGYHYYIAQDGKIYQGAPLSQRTQHVASSNRRTSLSYNNSSAIGITLMCGHLQIPQAQLDAAVKLGHAVQVTYGIASSRIFGHGELQTNRSASEGLVAARATRTTTPSGTSQTQYSLGNGMQALCTTRGPIPPGCTSQNCEVFAPVQNQAQASFFSPIQGNTGYSLPQQGSWSQPSSQRSASASPAVSSGYAPQPQPGSALNQRPTAVQAPKIQTDAGEWGYPDEKKQPLREPEIDAQLKKASVKNKIKEDEFTNEITAPPLTCKGKTLDEREAQLLRFQKTFAREFSELGSWRQVRVLRPTFKNERAIAYARSIYTLRAMIQRCIETPEE